MNRRRRILINFILTAGMIFLLVKMNGLFLDPIRAHEVSERSRHFGPSEVVITEEFEQGMFILGRYGDSVTIDISKKVLGIFWRFGSPSVYDSFSNEEPFDFVWSGNSMGDSFYLQVYGVVNDPEIVRLELELSIAGYLPETGSVTTDKYTTESIAVPLGEPVTKNVVMPINAFEDGMFFIWWESEEHPEMKVAGYYEDGTRVEVTY